MRLDAYGSLICMHSDLNGCSRLQIFSESAESVIGKANKNAGDKISALQELKM